MEHKIKAKEDIVDLEVGVLEMHKDMKKNERKKVRRKEKNI